MYRQQSERRSRTALSSVINFEELGFITSELNTIANEANGPRRAGRIGG